MWFTRLKTKDKEQRIKANEGYRYDLQRNFRSSMEANVFRFYTQVCRGIQLCEYEPTVFKIPMGFNGSKTIFYLPDFRITCHDGYQFYVEVKGFMDHSSFRKIWLAKQTLGLNIFIITPIEYKRIEKNYKHLLKYWE